MAKLTKRAKAIREKVARGKQYPLEEAIALLQEISSVKFKESVDVSVNLGVDPRKSDQAVRGATVLPNGTGKTVRVAVFTQGANAEAAKEAAEAKYIEYSEKLAKATEEIEKLIQDRANARKTKNWTEADNSRRKLDDMNVVLEDRPEGTIWKVSD